MSATIIQLHDGLTPHQKRRWRQRMTEAFAEPTVRADRSLCQDIANLHSQIEYGAYLAGAVMPANNRDIILESGREIDRVFLRLYDAAAELFARAADHYPDTQALPKPRRGRPPIKWKAWQPKPRGEIHEAWK